jgi:hypothetical protein
LIIPTTPRQLENAMVNAPRYRDDLCSSFASALT